MQHVLTYSYYIVVGAALVLGVLLVLLQTSLLPGYEVRIVQSGSMEPAITTGSLVLIQAAESYPVGEVITYQRPGEAVPTTHRIVRDGLERGELVYYTQGDANESVDPQPVPRAAVLGRVAFAVPFLGFLLDFARQPLGFILLVGIPALFIVIEEGGVIWRELRKGRKEPETAEVIESSV